MAYKSSESKRLYDKRPEQRANQAAYKRARYHRLRSEWIESQGSKCVLCGSTKNLEIDHVDRSTKRWNITAIWLRKESDRVSELAKCQLLCEVCHVAKSASEKMAAGHGRAMYKRLGCRCDVCKADRSAYASEWRKARESA